MWVCGVFLLTPIYKFLLLNLLVLSLLVAWLGTRTKSTFNTQHCREKALARPSRTALLDLVPCILVLFLRAWKAWLRMLLWHELPTSSVTQLSWVCAPKPCVRQLNVCTGLTQSFLTAPNAARHSKLATAKEEAITEPQNPILGQKTSLYTSLHPSSQGKPPWPPLISNEKQEFVIRGTGEVHAAPCSLVPHRCGKSLKKNKTLPTIPLISS